MTTTLDPEEIFLGWKRYIEANGFDSKLIRSLLDEAVRVKKIPWCACMHHNSFVEYIVNRKLSPKEWYPRETMAETCERRKREEST